MRLAGSVKFFDASKGWGFITRDDGSPDVFVHFSEVRRAKLDPLQDGQKLSFELADGKSGKGPRAVALQVR